MRTIKDIAEEVKSARSLPYGTTSMSGFSENSRRVLSAGATAGATRALEEVRADVHGRLQADDFNNYDEWDRGYKAALRHVLGVVATIADSTPDDEN